MANERKSKFDVLREQVWRKVEEWSKSVANGPLPAPIHELAKAWNIRRVRFEPLLSTAGLGQDEDGYVLFVNTEAPGATQSAGTVLEVDGNWRNFGSPLRFTLAHEISHVIFFDTAEGAVKHDLFRRHAEALENACSQAARVLLMPGQRLVREIGDQLFDVDHLRTLLRVFRVSAEVFVRRLQLPDMRGVFGNVDGLVTFAREEQGVIKTVASQIWGPQAHARFRLAQKPSDGNPDGRLLRLEDLQNPQGHALEDLHLGFDIEACLRGDERISRQFSVPGAHNMTLPCELTACRIHSQPLGFLIGIRVIDPSERES